MSKNYIVTGNYKYARSYDYEKNKIYHQYKNANSGVLSIKIENNKGIIKII